MARRAGDRGAVRKMLDTVGAWATANGLILSQTVVDDKSNKTTVIPQLFDPLEIKGGTITIDVAGCQKNIAAQIVDKQANEVLTVKGNQPTLEAALQQVFAKGIETNFADPKHECLREIATSHGRHDDSAPHVLKLPEEFTHKTERAKLNTMVVVSATGRRPPTAKSSRCLHPASRYCAAWSSASSAKTPKRNSARVPKTNASAPQPNPTTFLKLLTKTRF